MRWPLQVGSIPLLADCYQYRARETGFIADAVARGETTVLTQVLSGLGGVGKTQLAASYARAAWRDAAVELVMWVTASSREAIQASYAQAAREIATTAPMEAEQSAAWFLGWLQTTHRPWLIVLDDLQDPADVQGLWPAGPEGRCLVTTRRRDAVLPRTIRTHALVQRATLEHQPSAVISAAVTAAADGLVQGWPEVERDSELGRALRDNAAQLTDRYSPQLWDPEGHPVLFRAGRSFGECGLVRVAVAYWEDMVVKAEDFLGSDHPHTLTTRVKLAEWRAEAGDPAGAVTALEQLLTDQLRVLGPDHPRTVATRTNLTQWRKRIHHNLPKG